MEVHRELDYEFIKKQLQNYLNPGSVEEEAPAPQAPQQDNSYTLENNVKVKSDKVSEFDDLFNE